MRIDHLPDEINVEIDSKNIDYVEAQYTKSQGWHSCDACMNLFEKTGELYIIIIGIVSQEIEVERYIRKVCMECAEDCIPENKFDIIKCEGRLFTS